MCLHTEILWVFVAQELKCSRYSQSYRFDQGKTVVLCFVTSNVLYHLFYLLTSFFPPGFDLIADAKSKLQCDG